ncbi:MAG: MarR family winged helix-turn-helix transcriptional regulator, partial [Candidatus Sericytochromatia bacterium]
MEQYFFDQDKPDIESSIFSSLERLSEIFKLNLWKNNRNDNLSFLQVKILTIIKNNENTTVSHITETLKMSKSTISISISNLEKKGYISKEKNRADFRVVNLFLTDKGKDFLTKINGSVEDIKNNLKELPRAKNEDILKSL